MGYPVLEGTDLLTAIKGVCAPAVIVWGKGRGEGRKGGVGRERRGGMV